MIYVTGGCCAAIVLWMLCKSAKEADAAAERLWKEKENDH